MKDFTRKTLFVVGLVLLLVFLYYIRFIFIYIVIAVLLAYLMAAPVDWLVRHRIPRTFSIVIVFLIFAVLLGLLLILTIPVITDETSQLVKDAPIYMSQLEAKVNYYFERYYPGHEFVLADTIVRALESIQADTPHLVQRAFQTIRGLITLLLGFILVPLMCYYFLKDAAKIKSAFKHIFPQAYDERIDVGLSHVNRMLGSYVRGRLLLAILIWALVSAGLTIIGVKYPLLLGTLAGIAEFIPVIGPIIAYIPAGLLSLGMGLGFFLIVASFYIIVNIAESYFLAPRIMGDTMDLHPLTLIIAMIIGAYLAGIVGLLVALPAVAAIKIIFNIFVVRREEFGLVAPAPAGEPATASNPSAVDSASGETD